MNTIRVVSTVVIAALLLPNPNMAFAHCDIATDSCDMVGKTEHEKHGVAR